MVMLLWSLVRFSGVVWGSSFRMASRSSMISMGVMSPVAHCKYYLLMRKIILPNIPPVSSSTRHQARLGTPWQCRCRWARRAPAARHPPGRAGAASGSSPWRGTRTLRRTSRWSRTAPRPAPRGGWGRTRGAAAERERYWIENKQTGVFNDRSSSRHLSYLLICAIVTRVSDVL